MHLRFLSRIFFRNDYPALLLLWAIYVFLFGKIWYAQQSSLGVIVGVSVASTLGMMWLVRILKYTLQERAPEALADWQMTGARFFVYVIGTGFITGEFALGLLFVPFSYVTQATLLMLAFFLFWRTLKLRYSRKLTMRVFVREASMVACASAFILATTPWLPK
ncbi:MAG: hypothetical protein HYV65_02400 [Candidatus Spechtbacteria bacterium]|nr:hypothetical protein [Candidatus Spechtbacteria bacterium]